MWMPTLITVKQCSKPWDATHFCSCQEARPSLTEPDTERGNKKREKDDMRRDYIKEKGYKVAEMWECEWWENFKTDEKIKNHVRTLFLTKDLL